MKHHTTQDLEDRDPKHFKGVSYRWSLPDGTVCKGSTVIMSRTRGGLRSAIKRFWNTNTHVSPEVA